LIIALICSIVLLRIPRCSNADRQAVEYRQPAFDEHHPRPI
jgi:hypothetical protein